jgi:hypothetical protein
VTGHTIILGTERAAKEAVRVILAAPNGSVLKVSAPKRSNEQNDKFWAMVGDISRAKPEGRELPPDVWKALLMAEAGFKPRFEMSLDGQGVIPVGYKSSRLTKAEFSDLIEAAYAYGAQHGIQWSDEARRGE